MANLITIDQKHIDKSNALRQNGVYNCFEDCPIAWAARDSMNAEKLTVGEDAITVGTEIYRLPPDAQDFVEAFDHEKEVKPFSFWV